MEQPSMIDQYYEQFTLATAGTCYDVDMDEETAEVERRVREVSYNLWKDAQGKSLADRMETEKEEHFEQLYEFSYGVSMYEEDYFLPKRTDMVALLIIEEKDMYERKIRKARQQYHRFNEVCGQLSVEDKRMFTSYFEWSRKVDYEQLRQSIVNNLQLLNQYYEEDDDEEWRREAMRDRMSSADDQRIIPKPDMEKRNKRKNKMRQLFAE
ncbi:hypothetical protein CSV77_03635 [Sporosarcina sp. P16b]|uniref:hypothetical protein n=1 Tax=Sporosarcina sp. P16b TaxID=2048261 RepID=UPI000C171D5A|nr:hypothetical protein [Sporosarcina sp. P16b]PIC71143.1 hypothetical protein CSV77_03635 [Sporosarcina sp. P16b]